MMGPGKKYPVLLQCTARTTALNLQSEKKAMVFAVSELNKEKDDDNDK